MNARQVTHLLTNTTISAGSTNTPSGTEVKSFLAREATISVKVHGTNSASSGNVVIELLAYNGEDWDTIAFITLTVPFSGTDPSVKTFLIEVGEIDGLKVGNVTNEDATYDVVVDYIKLIKKD